MGDGDCIRRVLSGEQRWHVACAEVTAFLRSLPDECVQCAVTSPPFYGLRDYGTGTWEGGDPGCDHRAVASGNGPASAKQVTSQGTQTYRHRGTCKACGAVRVDEQIGSEQTSADYVAKLVGFCRELRRVLRPDGVFWLNLGDSYCTKPMGNGSTHDPKYRGGRNRRGNVPSGNRTNDPAGVGFKLKDLMGIPWRTAFALQDDGWYLRCAMPWVKRCAMTESVRDRPASALEYVFLLAKGPRYFFDMEAVKVPSVKAGEVRRFYGYQAEGSGKKASGNQIPENGANWVCPDFRNFRNADLWFQSVDGPHGLTGVAEEFVGLDVTSEGFKGAHFACFPQALVEPLVKSGTSERGCCPHCGKPWARLVSKDRKPTRPGTGSKVLQSDADFAANRHGQRLDADGPYTSHNGIIFGNRDPQRHCTVTKTTGWRQSCKCPEHEPRPCLVLDPFTGSGTSALVALRLGRHFLGCDLNHEYVAMARRRVSDAADSPLFEAPAGGNDVSQQPSLF